MKKCLSMAFALTLALGTMIVPAHAQEATQQVSTSELDALLQGSMASLSQSDDPFYGLSLLAQGPTEQQLKEMEAVFLPTAQQYATSARASAQDIEKLILLVEGFGYDATAYELNGSKVNLFDLLADKGLSLVNDYTFALEAMYSAEAAPTQEGLQKDALIKKLLSLRNAKDKAWNYNADYTGMYGSSDPDTTAMVLTALAPYVNNAASSMGISEETRLAAIAAAKDGFAYLSAAQKDSGAIDNFGENACSTSMVILAMGAYGKDVAQDAQFMKNGNSLVDGLMSFATADQKGFLSNYTNAYDDFTTEQAVRALLVVKHQGAPYALYQAGARLHQDRFQVTPPVVEPPVEEPKEEEPTKQPEKEEGKQEPIIKDTASADTSWMLMAGLMAAAAYGLYEVRKRA